ARDRAAGDAPGRRRDREARCDVARDARRCGIGRRCCVEHGPCGARAPPKLIERSVMDSAYLSAIAALAGSAIGGLTSLTASWVTQHVQFSAQERSSNRSRREDLYKDFIDEASRWYADAYEHDKAEISNLVNLYALVSRMRVLSSSRVVEAADKA